MNNFLILLIVLIFTSCSSSNDVVQNGFLQKRKYKKGYNLSFKKKVSKPKEVHEIEKNETDAGIVLADANIIIDDVEIDKDLNALKNPLIKVRTLDEKKILEANFKTEKSLDNYVYESALDKASSLFNKETSILEDREEVGVTYNTSRYVAAIAIMLIPFIVGFGILKRIKSIGKEEINKSKVFKKQAKETFWLVFTGFLMFLGIIVFSILSVISSNAMAFGGLVEAALVLLLLAMLIGVAKIIIKSIKNLIYSLDAIKEGKNMYEKELTKKQLNLKRLSFSLLMFGFIGLFVAALFSSLILIGWVGFILLLVSFFTFFSVFKTNNYIVNE